MMGNDIRTVWHALRGIVKDGCTFAEMKDLVGACGLPVEKLSHLQQKSLPAKGASKSQLLDAINDLIQKASKPVDAIRQFVAGFLEKKPHFHERVSECARRFGWTVEDSQLRPSDLQLEEATVGLSEEVRQLLRTAYSRYGQSDFPGAMTAVCSALDALTSHVYEDYNLGDPRVASYQERACRSFQMFEASYKKYLEQVQIDEQEVDRIWQNYKGSINQASYVLGAFRRNTSDVHGVSKCSAALVRHAIDCGTFIVRSITAGMDRDAQQLGSLDF